MFNLIALSEVTLVGLGGVFVLGGSVAIAFYRSHQAFRARERLYHSLCERIRRGDVISPSEYGDLSPEDRAALQALQLTKHNMLRRREATPTHGTATSHAATGSSSSFVRPDEDTANFPLASHAVAGH